MEINKNARSITNGNLILIFLASIFHLFFSCSKKNSPQKLFTQLPSSKTNITFKNQVNEDEHWNIIKYLYFYNGGGVAIGDINNDGLPDIYFSANQAPNQLYLNKGDLTFEDNTQKAGVAGHHGERAWKTGVTMADVNGDGWLDIYVCQVGFFKAINGQNELFINNQDGTFSEKAADFGLAFKGFSQQAAFFDYDNDGDLDMFLLNHSVHSSETFSKAENRKLRDDTAGDRLYQNERGKFKDVSEEAGIYGGSMGYGLGVSIADLNNDGWADIYVSNDFHENDYLYYNNGDRTFSENIKNSIGHTSSFSMGCDVADINNDGWLDILTLDMKPEDETILKASAGMEHYNKYQHKISFGYEHQYPRNSLQLNQGGVEEQGEPVYFSEIAQLSGIEATDWSWSPLIADFDNDGWKDVFITNGILRRPNDLDYLKFVSNNVVKRSASDMELVSKMPSGIVANYAFRNKGEEGFGVVFEDVSEKWGLNLEGCSHGAAYADFDNDGDLDLVVNNLNAEATIYRNNSEQIGNNNWMKVRLKRGNENRFGLGAKVKLITEDKDFTQELSTSRGWQSSTPTELVFGLGAIDEIQEIWVSWGVNQYRSIGNVKANQLIEIEDTLTRSKIIKFGRTLKKQSRILFEDYTNQINIPFTHKENRFTDFNVESLLPKMLSRESPKITVGDVNQDGLDDFFIGGAKAQANAVFIQKEGELLSFFQSEINKTLFEKEKMHEDVDAAFLDADGDGDLDLYVVSGGGEYRDGSKLLADRLYMNDGKGNFSKSENTLPEIFVNGSCIELGDFDGDGNIDVFVGSRSVTGGYGLNPKSYMLSNDGKEKFVNVTEQICPEIIEIGMVTDARWLEGEKKLIVVGEWMPITIFDFSSGKARKVEVENTHGWWNTIEAGDFDKDGDLDLLAGNFGLNSSLRTSIEQPVQLFVKDFDGNLQTDPILTYYRHDQQWVYTSKDQLLAQVLPLRKKFVDYAPFAQSTFQDIFSTEMMADVIQKKAQIFESIYIENLGDNEFKFTPLPLESQFAPIKSFLTGDFDEDGHLDALAVGNFYEFEPNIGRMDASYGYYLKGDGKGNFSEASSEFKGFQVFGEARDIELLNGMGGKKIILVSRNNDSLQVFR